MPPLPTRVASVHLASVRREACIVAAGKFGDSYCLLKNRDRNYLPEITLVHEVRDGVEVAYYRDASTGWVEGINEYGVGIVNAALMVSRDESERDEVERTGKKLKDGDRILHALLEKSVGAAAKAVRTYKDGLKGHTLVSDGKQTFYVEMPDADDVEHGEVPMDETFVRTNHGVEFPDAGYVSGPNEESSKNRQSEAEKTLAKVESPEDVAPSLLLARDDRWDPTEMVRDNRSDRRMRTTSQMVLDLTEKKLTFYILPGRVDFKGLDDKMPEGREPKITVEVLEYEDLTEDTDADTKKKTKKKAGLLPILDPAFNVREVFKQLVLLEDHLFHPRKRCPDCIWKHLLTCEALAEEAVTLDLDRKHAGVLDGLAERVRSLARSVQDEAPFDEVAQRAREIRKGLLGVASNVRVGSADVPDSQAFAPFKVGDLITYGKFQNKPGQIVRMFVDDHGIPSIEIAAVGHARRKNRIVGLFRVRHMDPAKRVASLWQDRRAVDPLVQALREISAILLEARDWPDGDFEGYAAWSEQQVEPLVRAVKMADVGFTGKSMLRGSDDARHVREILDYERGYWEVHLSDGGYSRLVLHGPMHQDGPRMHFDPGLAGPNAKVRFEQLVGHGYATPGGHIKVAEGKYKEKKKVKNQDGEETTVYVYSEKQVQHRHREKAKRYDGLSKDIDKLRKQVAKDVGSDDPKTRLTALAVALIDATFERVGNDGSADEGHFGVTGWQKKHVTFGKGKATIRYVGKSGVDHEKVVDDAKLVSALKECCEGKKPGDTLLSDEDVRVSSRDVNAYLEPFDVTAKDLRGFHANREMQESLRSIRKKGPKLPEDKKERESLLKDEFKQALEATAEAVGHEASTLRTQYLVPGLEDAYMKDGTVLDKLKGASSKSAIIHIDNATDGPAIVHIDDGTDGPGGPDYRGLNGLLSSLTLYEKAVVLDMDIHGDPIVRAESEVREVGWTYPPGTYLLRGHEVQPGAVMELTAAGYLAEEERGVFVLSPMYRAKRQLYVRGSSRVATAWLRGAGTRYVPMHVVRARYYDVPQKPDRVWEWSQGQPPPTVTSIPRYHVNAFISDYGHDWQWKAGKFKYSGTGGRKDAWLVLQYGEDAPDPTVTCSKCGVDIPAYARFCPACGQAQDPPRTATKSPSEREEEEVERLVRPSPKKKPPRTDSRRERIDTSEPEEKDPDFSFNYKDVGG